MDKQNVVHTQREEYYSAMKSYYIMIHVTIWMNFENLTLCEKTNEKDIRGQILYNSIWHGKKF